MLPARLAPRGAAGPRGPRRPASSATAVRGAPKPAARQHKQQQCSALPPALNEVRTAAEQLARRAAAAAAAAVVSASLLLAPAGPALSEPSPEGSVNIIRLPASDNPAVLVAQQTMVQAWQIVGESFFDPTFAGHNWTDELRSHMLAAYAAPDGPGAYAEIRSMLADLGDPYTRLLPPDEYEDFVVSSSGELQGVGMLISNEPVDDHLLVLASIKGSPADRAGIQPGDIVTEINGEDTAGWTGEQAAQHLRGQGGTQVRVRLVRHTDMIPGVPGRPPPLPVLAPRDEVVEVSLTRETVALSPLFYAALPGLGGAPPVGYLKLAAFSQNAAQAVRDAVAELKSEGVGSYVLDLRSNPGGLVQSAAEIARVFMDGSPTLFTISGREGEQLQEVGLDEGPAQTGAPLAVLVDRGSASASEILSGALRDNHRALVIGDEKTYGKGRIQSVYEMDDGSALFVTVARYRTPAGDEIDLRGIRPDMACTPPIVGAARGGRGHAGPAPSAARRDFDESILPDGAADRCLLTALNELAAAGGAGGGPDAAAYTAALVEATAPGAGRAGAR